MEVVRNGSVIAAARGLALSELSGMAAMGLLLLVGLAAFLPARLLLPKRLLTHPYVTFLVITIPVLDLVALLIGSRLVQVWMGRIGKNVTAMPDSGHQTSPRRWHDLLACSSSIDDANVVVTMSLAAYHGGDRRAVAWGKRGGR